MLAKNYHFIAIGGIGMSALARIILDRGGTVTGSDVAPSYVTRNLEKAGATIIIGHRPENLPTSAVIVYSTAIGENNPEFAMAKKKGYKLIHRAELLAELMESSMPLLVAGTHGKTTTSSLLAHALIEVGFSPSFAVGGIVHSVERNGAGGQGPYFIAEACESDGTFLLYPGYGGILTNIDKDHLDYWKDMSSLMKGFHTFAEKISSKEHFFICADDPLIEQLAIQGRTYGFSPQAQIGITQFSQTGWKITFDLRIDGSVYKEIELPLIGRHNALNGAAVFALMRSLDVDEDAIRKAFLTFKGISRRLEKKGEAHGIEIYDDYGHHPTEIITTLQAVRSSLNGKRLVVAFQPQRYTRTRDCMEEFADAFSAADVLYITDVYSAGETPLPGVDAKTLLEKVEKKVPFIPRYSTRNELAQHLREELRSGDILVTLGAGDITKVGGELLELWKCS